MGAVASAVASDSAVALLSAASALRKSPSLRLLDHPPPGVLAPDMTEFVRERTFITRGLQIGSEVRSRSEQLDGRADVQGVTLVLILVLGPLVPVVVARSESLHLYCYLSIA